MFEGTNQPVADPGDEPFPSAVMDPETDPPAPAELPDLIAHIVTRYHDVHRGDFPQAIALAQRVEAVHAAEAECPRGLADHLALMFDDLQSHQAREEQVLFPMLLAGGHLMVRFPIARMMAEHRDVEEQLLRLQALTRDFSSPPQACGTWQTLARLCRKIDVELREHMRTENERLFLPFLE